MNNRRVLVGIQLTFAITVAFSYLVVYGSGEVRAFFDNTADLYQIKKSIVWVVIISFTLILAVTQAIVQINVIRRKDAEISLLGSEEVLRTLINGAPDLIFFKDSIGRYLEINDAMLDLFGFDKSSYRGKQKQQLDEESPLFRTISNSCLISDDMAWEQGSSYRKIEELDMPDGTKRTFDIVKTPIFYANGMRKGIVTLAREITTYKEAEEKLEKKERILRATLNATDDGILVVDNNRQVLDANDLYFNMWGIPFDIYSLKSETANMRFIMKQLVDPNTFESWVNFIYETPVTEHYTAELLDGRIFDIFSAPLMEKGKMIGRVWSFRDTTARLNTEKELQESEERYRTLVELSPDAIIVSLDGKNVFSNMAAAKLLGANSTDDILHRSIMDFVHPDTKALTEKHFNDIINGREQQIICEQKLVRSDGKCIDAETIRSAVPFKGENAVMSVIRDITERKRSEELRNKMDENMRLLRETLEYDRIRTEFLANISHEVKTPLNVIIGTLQLYELTLNRENPQESFDKLLKYTAIMKQNCFRLLRLLNNLVCVSEIDSGFVEMHVANNDLVQMVKSLVSSASSFIENKGVQIELDIETDKLEIACDADKINRVLLNLLSNAVKFTESGGSIRVSLYSRGNSVYISVKDTGIGIPEEMEQAIFQRFRQVDKSFTRNHEGSGIGLSLVKSLVEMHSGSVEVRSEYGKGSEFTVKLPLRVIESDEIAAAAEETACVCLDMVNIEFSDIY